MPDGEIKVTANGELTVQREGALSTIELSPGKIKLSTNSTVEMAAEGQPFNSTDEVSVKFRKEYKSKIADLFGDAKLSWNSVSGQAEITCSLAVVAKINGQKFITTKISMPRPNVFLFSFEPREVKGDGFEGKVGFDVERTYYDRARPSETVPIPIRLTDSQFDPPILIDRNLFQTKPDTKAYAATFMAAIGLIASYAAYAGLLAL